MDDWIDAAIQAAEAPRAAEGPRPPLAEEAGWVRLAPLRQTEGSERWGLFAAERRRDSERPDPVELEREIESLIARNEPVCRLDDEALSEVLWLQTETAARFAANVPYWMCRGHIVAAPNPADWDEFERTAHAITNDPRFAQPVRQEQWLRLKRALPPSKLELEDAEIDALRKTRDEDRRRVGIPRYVRHAVWRRDEGRCTECGSREGLEFDHIIPWSRGGSDTERNLRLLCETCNRRKSDQV